jgi:hypothetical protein
VVAESTISSSPLRSDRDAPENAARPYLVLVMLADDPAMPPSRHLLDAVDEVRFSRGPRRTARTVDGRRAILELRVPDSRMSADNGRLFRGPLGWVLEDLHSKNGAIVDGVATRRATVSAGALIELGYTSWLFCVAPVAPDAAADCLADDLRATPPGLATFDGPLGHRFAELTRIAPSSISVMLLGETGTGKELVARALHHGAGRPGAFVAVNCGALPATLIEAELFGSRPGAFTGATRERLGLVRSAEGGTLFLDEIGELPPAAQAALLRVLQEREVTPLGSDRPVKIDVRLCVATLRDLATLVARGGFRPDLYARLLGFSLTLPPLRERRCDFGLLVSALLAQAAGGRAIQFTPVALRAMLQHDWPFNIRELEKTLTTAIALADDGVIGLAQLPDALRRPTAPAVLDAAPGTEDASLHERLIALLIEHHGNVVAVAKALRVRRTQVYRWLRRFDIKLAQFRNT